MSIDTQPVTGRPGIVLFRGRGLISALIRWQTRGRYSHAALLQPDGRIIEAWQGAGVRRKYLNDWSGADIYDVPGLTDKGWGIALQFAAAQLGKRYDYRGVCRFVTRNQAPSNDRWFCSELVYAACAEGGLHLLQRNVVTPGMVSPQMLGLSPLLSQRWIWDAAPPIRETAFA